MTPEDEITPPAQTEIGAVRYAAFNAIRAILVSPGSTRLNRAQRRRVLVLIGASARTGICRDHVSEHRNQTVTSADLNGALARCNFARQGARNPCCMLPCEVAVVRVR